MSAKHLKWVDFAKGIAILLVIVGHTLMNPFIRGIIFSFHMPLFFILSGYTSRTIKDNNELFLFIKKISNNILLPCFIVSFCRFTVEQILNQSTISAFEILKTMVLRYLMSSGVAGNIFGIRYKAIGIYWFIVVYSLARIIYGLLELSLSENSRTFVSIILCICGIAVSKIIWIPFSFDIVMVSIIFYAIGKKIKKIQIRNTVFLIVSIIIWISSLILCFSIKRQYLELAPRIYPAFPICFLGAIAGSLVIFRISIFMSEYFPISSSIEYIGANSITLFYIHSIDVFWLGSISGFITKKYLLLFIRLFIDISIFMIIQMIKRERLRNENGMLKS